MSLDQLLQPDFIIGETIVIGVFILTGILLWGYVTGKIN